MPDINVENLTRHFTGVAAPAVHDISFSVKEGEILVLLGPSGCGKTTTLRCIGGLEKPDAGRITMGGRTVFDAADHLNVPPHRRRLGIVFQTFALWPHLTASRNIEYPLRAARWKASDRAHRVAEVAGLVDLSDEVLGRRPAQLSGGQQQRVSLARALAHRPGVILFDEPLSNLDTHLRAQLRGELSRLHRELGFTGVYVTHDLAEAASLGDSIAVMHAGKIEQIGSAQEVFSHPANEHLAKVLGYRKVADLHLEGDSWTTPGGSVTGVVPTNPVPTLSMYSLPSALHCRPGGTAVPDAMTRIRGGVVRDRDFLGLETRLRIGVGDVSLHVQMPRAEATTIHDGDLVDVDIPSADVVYFGPDGNLVETTVRVHNDNR